MNVVGVVVVVAVGGGVNKSEVTTRSSSSAADTSEAATASWDEAFAGRKGGIKETSTPGFLHEKDLKIGDRGRRKRTRNPLVLVVLAAGWVNREVCYLLCCPLLTLEDLSACTTSFRVMCSTRCLA